MKIHSRHHRWDSTHTRTKCGKPIASVHTTGFNHRITCNSCLRAELAGVRSNIKYLQKQEEEILERIITNHIPDPTKKV